jgi:hypothetical protein
LQLSQVTGLGIACRVIRASDPAWDTRDALPGSRNPGGRFRDQTMTSEMGSRTPTQGAASLLPAPHVRFGHDSDPNICEVHATAESILVVGADIERKAGMRFLMLVGAVTASSVTTKAALIEFQWAPGLVYDTVQDITWLKHANYAGLTGHTVDGVMDWYDAHAWTDQLVIDSGGVLYTDWRLPFTASADSAPGVVDGELGQLFDLYDITSDNPGPFIDLRPEDYWYGPEFDADRGLNFTFDPDFIGTYWNFKDDTQFEPRVMPVFDGMPIPTPAGVLLLALAGVQRRR